MELTYTTKKLISVESYVDLISSTSLKDRRPLNDYDRIEQMLKKASLTVTAWDGITKDNIHNNAKIILLAAPQSEEYYPHIGFEKHNAAFVSSGVFVI